MSRRRVLPSRVAPAAWGACFPVALTLLSGVAPGCAGPFEHEDVLEGVVYRGAVTDEALARLLDQAPTSDAAPRVSIVVPTGGAVLSAMAPVEFAYEDSSAVELRVPRDLSADDGYGEGSRRAAHAARPKPGWLERLGLVRVAHAHGDPFNGRGYYLSVVDASGARLLAVFTDASRYAPSEAEWVALASGTDPLELTIAWADFDANDIPAGGGPFLTPAVGFRVE